jgi:hypothetical protein
MKECTQWGVQKQWFARKGARLVTARHSLPISHITLKAEEAGFSWSRIRRDAGLEGVSFKKRVQAVTRQMAWGRLEQAHLLLKRSGGGSMLNTAFIERFNGTMRERLATLTRKCRHPARRLYAL